MPNSTLFNLNHLNTGNAVNTLNRDNTVNSDLVEIDSPRELFDQKNVNNNIKTSETVERELERLGEELMEEEAGKVRLQSQKEHTLKQQLHNFHNEVLNIINTNKINDNNGNFNENVNNGINDNFNENILNLTSENFNENENLKFKENLNEENSNQKNFNEENNEEHFNNLKFSQSHLRFNPNNFNFNEKNFNEDNLNFNFNEENYKFGVIDKSSSHSSLGTFEKLNQSDTNQAQNKTHTQNNTLNFNTSYNTLNNTISHMIKSLNNSLATTNTNDYTQDHNTNYGTQFIGNEYSSEFGSHEYNVDFKGSRLTSGSDYCETGHSTFRDKLTDYKHQSFNFKDESLGYKEESLGYKEDLFGFRDDLAGFSEFEKGLFSLYDETSTQQGSSLLSSPEQPNNLNAQNIKTAHATPNTLDTMYEMSNKTDRNRLLQYLNSVSTTFGDSNYSSESLYNYQNNFYQPNNYYNYSKEYSNYEKGYNYSKESEEIIFGDKGYYGNYIDLREKEDETPFTHVVSSVATVADTVTPLCADLNTEFSESAHALLERYLMGDITVENELFSLFAGEFTVDACEVYNTIVKYCNSKLLLQFSHKLLLLSDQLVDNINYFPNHNHGNSTISTPTTVNGNNALNTVNGKSVTAEVYSETLVLLLSMPDSTQLSRSLLNHLLSPTESANCLDLVIKKYVTTLIQLTRKDSGVMERLLSILENHQGRLNAKLSCLLVGYLVQIHLLGKPKFDNFINLTNADATSALSRMFRMMFYPKLNSVVKFVLRFVDIMVNPDFSVDFLESSKLLVFLEFCAVNFGLSYGTVVVRLLEKRALNALTFINSLQLALLIDYPSVVTKISLSSLQTLKSVVPIEFTTPNFGKFEFITLENINKLIHLITISNSSTQDKSSISNGEGKRLVTNLLEVCKQLFGSDNKELFVPLVECCLLAEDFQSCESVMKYYCDYYGMVSEPICEKVLLSIALKGNFNHVNRLLKGTQSYESCEVFLTHSSYSNNENTTETGVNANSGTVTPGNSAANGLVRISTYLVRVCIAILNFTVALNYVKPLLRSNHQNEEISSSLMMVATRLDSRSKLDSFLTFCERTSILINEACFNVILDSCIKLKNNKRLLRIINKFRVWGLLPNIQTFGIIIKTLSSSNLIHDCEELFYHYITAQNNTGNVVNANSSSAANSTSTASNAANNSEIVYGCMFDAYVNNNSVDSAMRLFEDMKERGKVRPNTIMYTTLIKGYGQNKQLDKAMRIFRLMQQDGVEPNTVTYNSIIDACARVGEMGSATRLLEEMLSSGIEPDLITFSTIIKGYCVQSDMDKSFQLLSVMYERGIMPDVILYNSLLEGCVKSGLLWLCEKLWSQMQEYNIPPSNFTLTILIKMYGRSGQLDKVFELADELPKRYNFSINTHVYTCLMSACITNGRYAMVLDIYKYMKINGVKPDAKTFETIIQGLSRGSLFKEAAHVVTEVYSLSNSNNGEAQIPNINVKILQRLFQRFYNSVNTHNSAHPSTHGANTIHTPNTNGATHTNGNNYAANNVILLNTASSGALGGVDDAEELNSIYTSLARRLELFGIKVPKY